MMTEVRIGVDVSGSNKIQPCPVLVSSVVHLVNSYCVTQGVSVF